MQILLWLGLGLVALWVVFRILSAVTHLILHVALILGFVLIALWAARGLWHFHF